MNLPRIPLYSKVLLIALLNLTLLGVALAVIVRAQFRVDPGSFLLAPAESRIMSAARAVALDLDQSSQSEWDEVLQRHSQSQRVVMALFDEFGDRIAGPDLPIPQSVSDRIPRRERRRQESRRPPPERREERDDREPRPGRDNEGPEARAPAPPLVLSAASNPTGYWAGARIPVRRDPRDNPHPGTLMMMSTSLLASRLFFDVTPWLTIGLAIVLISAACWLPFIRGMTRSIGRLTRATGRIAEGQFDVQVDAARRDEIGQLGAAVNRMAARLSAFVHGQKAFMSGIAHELCTPIATIQFGLGNLERRVGQEHGETIADIQEEVQHMSALVNELLSFSRAGIGALDLKLGPVSVRDTLARVADREAKGDNVQLITAVDASLWVMAEPEHLFRALSNVVRNSVCHAGNAGPIEVAARVEPGSTVCITVSDHGPGVPPESLEQIFAPFYRLDPARTQGGLGLGLAIVRNSIEGCGGSVRCRNRQPSGLEVEIRLPAAKLPS